MITRFNRREVTVTFDVTRLAKIREVLTVNGIDYKIKIFNRGGSGFGVGGRSRMGNFGIQVEYGREFAVYVKKEDFENAKALIE